MSIALADKPVAPALHEAIRELVTDRLKSHGLEKIEIAPDVDFDGDPVIRVHVHMAYTEIPYNPYWTLPLYHEIPQLTRKSGELRFPHLEMHFSEEQSVVDLGP